MLSNTQNTLKKHLRNKLPITQIEASIYYGICSADRRMADLKRHGLKIIRERVLLSDVVKRINKSAKLSLPKTVPSSKIMISQYRIK